METLRIAVCDDDAPFRAYMAKAVRDSFQRAGTPAEVFACGSAEELAAAMGHRTFQLLFLDIELPGADGIRFGEQLRALGSAADVIFVSNREERVYEAFRVHPWCFLRKSRFTEELDGATARYAEELARRVPRVTLQGVSGELRSFDPGSLVYVESAGKLQKLFGPGGEPFSVRCPLHELEASLEPLGFLRIHKGFLVNYRCIRRITSRGVLLDSGDTLPVGRDRLQEARDRYLALMKWKGSVG